MGVVGAQYWFTSPSIGPANIFTGNRVLAPDAKGGFPKDVESFDIALPSDVKWIVAADTNLGPQFVATTADGSAYLVNSDGDVQQMDTGKIDPDRPPLVMTIDQDGNETEPLPIAIATTVEIVEFLPSAQMSPLSHPLPIFSCGKDDDNILCGIFAYIDTNGNIILYDVEKGKDSAKYSMLGHIIDDNALPDARIVMAPANPLDASNNTSSKLLAVYGGATEYDHCVLGDCLEGSSLILFSVTLKEEDGSYLLALERQITLPSGDVFEGLYPMFIEDGATIVTTVANSYKGAWLRTYNVFSGDVVSESSYIGWGWRHMLFYNNFAPIESGNDPLYSLVEVLTPHVRKELQLFDISTGSTMEKRSSTSKYTTHDIGWRYLDTAISGDLNGDGINEAILLDEDLKSLVSFQLDLDSSELREVWSMSLVGKLTSNIAAVSFGDKKIHHGIAVAAASGHQVRIWVSTSPETIERNQETPKGTTTYFQPSKIPTPTTAISNTTSIEDEPYASNDGLGISFSNSEQKSCSVQSTWTYQSGIILAILFLVYAVARY